MNSNKIIATMIVYNEADRWLAKVLDRLNDLVETIVILDDASTDNTEKVCKSFNKVVYYKNKKRMFDKDEHLAREKLWKLAIKENPDWVICLDADEFFEKGFNKDRIKELINGGDIAYSFHIVNLYENEDTIVGDPRWFNQYNVRLFKYLPDKDQSFYNKKLHCGSAPKYAHKRAFKIQDKIFHYGYLTKKVRKYKKDFYSERDPYYKYHSQDWYKSINKKPKKLYERRNL